MADRQTPDDPAHSDTIAHDSAAAASASIETPELVAGRYGIIALVGRGGMGSVYRARDIELDEIVALKVLNRELVDRPELIERFRREVKLARRVTHPNVARVFDIGEHGGLKFLTMEFIEGESLEGLMRRAGPLSIPRVLDIAGGVCAGLAAAHHAGVVHRDLKPDNVMLAKDGRVVITDFGIARDPVAAAQGETLGIVVGTPAYMAPEQVEASTTMDARTDIYALGVMLFELFTGELPFKGSSAMALAAARLYAPPPDPRTLAPTLPAAIAEVVLRCLARDRAARFADALEVANALSASSPTLEQGSAIPKPSIPPPSAVAEGQREKAVAVLPFRNLGPSGDEYVADGITDDLIDSLSMTAGLRVRPRGSVTRFKGVDADPREIGRDLGVDVVVEGSVRRLESRVRLTARVTSVEDGFQLWAQRFDRPANDLLVVSDETARAVAEALTVRSAGRQHVAPSDAGAVDLYLKARAEVRDPRNGSIERAIELFRAAHERAPEDIAILSGYARACARLWFFRGDAAPQAASDALRLAELASKQAPGDPEALMALASVRLMSGDPRGAAELCRRAIERAPDNNDTRELYARLLLECASPERAVEVLEPLVREDPNQGSSWLELIRAYALMGDYSRVREAIEQARPLGRGVGPGEIVLRGRLAIWAPAELASLLDLEIPDAAMSSPWQVLRVARRVVHGEDVEGDLKIFEGFAEQQQTAPRFMTVVFQTLAEIEGFRRRVEPALDHLERTVAGGLFDIVWVDRCAALAPLRAHPRFLATRAVVAERASAIREALGVV